MKRFFIVSLVMLTVALLTTITVWYLLQAELSEKPIPAVDVQSSAEVVDIIEEEAQQQEVHTEQSDTDFIDAIPLRNLPLSEDQRTIVSAAGIDVDTFIITPEMISCAKVKLGVERFDSILAGDSPTFFEATSLLGCIR